MTLDEALCMHNNDFAKTFDRLICNDLQEGRAPEHFYDTMERLVGWNVNNCLAADK